MYTELGIRKRVFLLLVLVFVLFSLLSVRVGYLTTARSAYLTQKGVRQWTRDGAVYARRGDILDTNGQVLVMSTTAYVVNASPRHIRDAEGFCEAVCPLLGIDEGETLAKLKGSDKAAVTLKRQVPRETVDALRYLTYSGGLSCFDAITLGEDVRRYYAHGELLSQVLGLTNIDSVGQSGLEQQYEALLRGTPGRIISRVDARSRPLYDEETLYVEPQEGASLVLTVDANIQQVCEKAMRECIEVNKAKAVHALVMDVRTGAILAACTKPGYDPNDPPRNDVKALNELMRIRLISDVYEPGSTFKVLTAAAALDSGVTTPEDTFYCSAKITVDGDTIRCWGNPHKAETMADAIRNSCNPVFVELALRMGQETMYKYLQTFGLGSKTQVDLQGEGNGILIRAGSVKNVDLARIGFGQSVAVTPIQLLTAACSVVNGGKLMRPYILKEVLAPDGSVLMRTQPKMTANTISEETSRIMRELLESVVSEGGAKNAAIAGQRIGGKTGTAQVYKQGKIVRNVHIGSFFGFAPADNPRVAVLVIVDEADVPVDYGGTTAAPFAGQILADVLPYLGFYPHLPGDAEKPPVEVPSVTGMELSTARKTLSGLMLKAIDDGYSGVVTAQSPPEGAMLKQGGQVMLYTQTGDVPTVESLCRVPDIAGMSITMAGRTLRQRGFDMEIEGSGLAVSQSPAAEELALEGSRVFVTFALPTR